MSKRLITIFTIFALCIPFIVNAADKNVKTVEASLKDNKISVKGTVEDGVLAVSIMVYDENDALVAMQSTSVDDNNKYSDTIELKDGNYTIKCANYDGGKFVETKVNISSKKSVDKGNTISNPETIDNIVKYAIILVISVTGVILVNLYFKKKLNTNK